MHGNVDDSMRGRLRKINGAIRNNLTRMASIVIERLAGGPLVRYTPALRLYVVSGEIGHASGCGKAVCAFGFAEAGLH
jgi:hypothetical protein